MLLITKQSNQNAEEHLNLSTTFSYHWLVAENNLNSYFKLRKKACEEINRKYGLNVNVKVNSDLKNIIKTYDSTAFDLIPDDEEIEKEGVEEDG